MEGLTPRQREILAFVQKFSGERGFPPTMREIAAHFGIRSLNGVSDHLGALERKGYVERQPGSPRGLRLLSASERRKKLAQEADPKVCAADLVRQAEEHEGLARRLREQASKLLEGCGMRVDPLDACAGRV